MKLTFQNFIPSTQPSQPEKDYYAFVQSHSGKSAGSSGSSGGGGDSAEQDDGPVEAEGSKEREQRSQEREEKHKELFEEPLEKPTSGDAFLLTRQRLSRLFQNGDGTGGEAFQPLRQASEFTGANKASAHDDQSHFRQRREASRLTDEQRDVMNLTSRLPEGFPVDDWDNMSARKQLRTIRRSDLDEQEQWRVLNATTSLKTLAAIGDIQRNRTAYGLSEKRANDVTDSLLRIANARQGVHNRDIDFHSDNQRNLFLRTLEEKEESLLGPLGIGRQNSSVQEKLANNLGMQNGMWYDNKVNNNPTPKLVKNSNPTPLPVPAPSPYPPNATKAYVFYTESPGADFSKQALYQKNPLKWMGTMWNWFQ